MITILYLPLLKFSSRRTSGDWLGNDSLLPGLGTLSLGRGTCVGGRIRVEIQPNKDFSKHIVFGMSANIYRGPVGWRRMPCLEGTEALFSNTEGLFGKTDILCEVSNIYLFCSYKYTFQIL